MFFVRVWGGGRCVEERGWEGGGGGGGGDGARGRQRQMCMRGGYRYGSPPPDKNT